MIEIPQEHVEDAQKLHADAYVHLYHFILTDGSHIYLTPNNTITWQGNTYTGIGINFTGVHQTVDEEASRPTMVVVNPKGVFSAFVVQGKLDKAQIIRLRVLKTHIDQDVAIYSQTAWVVNRIPSMNKTQITMELRNQLDGPNFLVPARMFIPPEFPSVSL